MIRAVVVMGVAGAGKTTVGRMLADELGWDFCDGDDLHPPANIARMSCGESLTDADRLPWLQAINDLLRRRVAAGDPVVVAASALKQAYRVQLADGVDGLRFVYLRIDPQPAEQRLRRRQGHFATAELLPGQFEALEEPADALIVDAGQPPADIVRAIRRAFAL